MAQRRDDWFVKAGQTWHILSQQATRRELTTYKELGAQIGLHHRVVRHALGIIQSYCSDEHLPILAAIVVNAAHGKPGSGSIAAGRDDINEMQADVFNHPWTSLPNPFDQFAAGQSLETFTKEIVANPDRSGEVYARVKIRGVAQRIFRNAVSQTYNWQCAMCGLSFLEALEAAHIIPWAEATPQQRMDPRNGILLCATHHKMFDADTVTLTENYRVRHYDPEKVDEPYSKADEQMSLDLHGQPLNLPDDERHWPNLEWVKQRNEFFELDK